MNIVKVFYQHREGGTELIDHERTLKSHCEACEIIDNYPWAQELALFETLGEGGGFFFLLGDAEGQYASYQFTPVETDRGFLDLDVVYQRGVMRIFGRKSVLVDFELVSIAEAKHHIKELFEYSVDGLYNKYKK
ncbi:hypothetical protein VR7878_03666 [Vibrio ruber DSM 16370]|uniref:Uncharacterized protein n=1 Tax=Vibrio ruber (strain DSM 16370 / JCM 11486 / BCRC 17186 / CECT 7878 / LMG 23124 / VR1) TaxID=1123498 RepID=A0A1R4LTQ1_VIBR1|nr:hypothetical protein [Vibrio ruber]SJN59769.1 hypothetical protein VR7878_03666 [Vibrio ruber DSM 16370]